MPGHHQSPVVLRNSSLAATAGGSVVVILGLLSSGCTPSQAPSRLAQVCVHNDEGISQFRSELEALATERQMNFVDGSEELRRHLEITGYVGPGRKKGDPVVNFMVIERKDGPNLHALNVGLHTYQLALVFSGGKDQGEMLKFSEDAIARLSQKWNVEDVPKGAGVLPNDDCR